MDILSMSKSVTRRIESPLNDVLTTARVLGNPRTPVMLALSKGFVEPVYRAAFLSSAAGCGVLRWLSVRPCDLDTLADKLEVPAEAVPRLRDWLEMGVRLGDLGRSEGCYRLRGPIAKAFAQPGNDALVAALEEVMRFHLPALLDGPRMLREGRRFSLGDQDGAVIARSTRVVQPLVEEALARTLVRDTPQHLLEIGCGSGVYVRHAARLNPRLTAVAVDMQEQVAAQAAANLADWGLADRVETRQGDLRSLRVQPVFDLVTLHNSIYYFAEDERVEALRRARACLAPGGTLLITSPCQGGNIGMEALNLWFSYADFGGPLPREGELLTQLREAGFREARADRIVPGEQFRAFTAVNSDPAQS